MDLLQQLAAPFPVSAHSPRKLKGGKFYIFVGWEHYTDRLNQVLGLGWSVSYSDPAIAGDYLMVRSRLTIQDGLGQPIHREGVGSTRVYPELNDEGKEKIIGDPLKNACRDALRDACYQLGMGRYLDNQAEVCRMLGVTAEQLWNQRQPKQKGEISREEWQRRQNLSNSIKKSKSSVL